MKRARNIFGFLAVLLALMWIASVPVIDLFLVWKRAGIHVDRSGTTLVWLDPYISLSEAYFEIKYMDDQFSPNEEWINGPRFEYNGDAYVAYVPYWLSNLVAWSLFIFFRRRSRLRSEGCCKKCGYDLTDNESGRCPEGNPAVEVA